MITIDTEGKLSAKQAKELSSSINMFIGAITKNLISNIDSANTTLQFRIHFDNESSFIIYAGKDVFGQEKSRVVYEDEFGIEQDVISLQDALNLNKYVRDFELMVKNDNIVGNNFRGFYTLQDTNKKIAIYNENDVKQRFIERDQSIHFTTENENYDIEKKPKIRHHHNIEHDDYDDLGL